MPRLFLAALVFLLAACGDRTVTHEFTGQTMGTTYNIVVVDKTGKLDPDDLQAAIDRTLASVNASMSNWDPNSEISRFNAQQSTRPVEISPELATVMAAANAVHAQSLGQFDVTLGPVIELWGFGAPDADTVAPTDAEIADALRRVGQMTVLTFAPGEPATMRKHLPGTSVYLAAIAKGYGIDRLADTLHGFQIRDFMVEIGGDLVTSGRNRNGEPWRIGIEKPDVASRTVEEVVTVSDLGMATSGDYRNYFEENGIRYSHIFDADTGRPISHRTASVTVLAPDAMMADAWATALLALGSEMGLPLAEDLGLAVLFIDRTADSRELTFESLASSRFRDVQPSE